MDKNESGIMTHKGKKIWDWDGWSISADVSENEYSDDDLYATVNSYLEDEKEVIVSLKKKKIVYELEDREDNNIIEEYNGVFEVYDTNTYDTHTYLSKDISIKKILVNPTIISIIIYVIYFAMIGAALGGYAGGYYY